MDEIPTDSLHAAIIMDGNGRWAAERGWPRTRGHRAGADSVRGVIEAAPHHGIAFLTLYAFSSDNWRRPAGEVSALMSMFSRFLRSEADRCRENGVRLSVIGRRDRLRDDLLAVIDAAEQTTLGATKIHVQIAVDYSARDSIVRASRAGGNCSREEFARRIAEANNADPSVPPVDLLIRTGREQRLSDFLLWECAYAELYFSNRMWPDFDAGDLACAVDAYRGRQRRFGAVLPPDERAPSASVEWGPHAVV
ncbi:MAG: polyprenyl diphosphate synthase [Acidobacteriota bacterium]